MPPTKIDAYASAPQYLHHMVPVWRALGPARGVFYVQPDILEMARGMGVKAELAPVPALPDRPVFVSASGNLNHCRTRGRSRVALMEHGCGLSYGGDRGYLGRVAAKSSSYAGGDGRPASLFLHPGEHPAARDRARYPRAQVEVVGCPKLDDLPARDPSDPTPTIAFSFHWDTEVAPETRSSFIYYRDHLALFAKAAAITGEFKVIGHGHPRIMERLAPWYERKHIEVVRDFDEVCRRADVYAVDNSSTLYEFASTGRNVIVLNGPFYRKDIHHGLRFWDAADVGPNLWEPYDIEATVRRVLAHPHEWDERRERAVNLVYAFRSGAAKRAADTLKSWARAAGEPAVSP